MIRAVLFDVGGTLHVADNTPALADRFSELLIRRLAEHGIVLPVDAKSLTPLLHQMHETLLEQLVSIACFIQHHTPGQ